MRSRAMTHDGAGAPSRHEADTSANGFETALAALPEERARSRVTYEFASDDQAASWVVERMQLTEAVSAPYEAIVDLVSLEHDDPARLLGLRCTLTMRRDDAVRRVHGIVRQVAHAEPGSAHTTTQVTIVPALALLALRVDCRMFQDKTVPEVLDEVLAPALGAHGRTHQSSLRRTDYPRREYIVQHRESDLSFVERLLAEEGIWYYFAQPTESMEAEVLTLLDANDDAPRARFGRDGERLPIDRAKEPIAHRQSASRFVRELALCATSVEVQAVNWTDPWQPIQHIEPPAPGPFARYEPHGVTISDYRERCYAMSDARTQARIRLDAQPGRVPRARGAGNIVGLAPGQRLEVSLDPFHRDDRLWIVTSVHARGRDAQRTDRAAETLADYACEFTCALADVPLRPPRKPKPTIHGAQTARVVGPDGKPEVAPGADDIHTDEHGRIQVRFDWDRSVPGTSTTCFLRVAQAWAGSGLGFHFVPRIGMEVIVSFVEGDPDRPLVTGCLYNGLNRAVYDQPAHKTRSYIRTQSSPSGQGSNELSFEDADGHEVIALHAQRDHREVVRRDQHVTIGGARRIEVFGDCTRAVVGDACDEIGGMRRVKVQRDDALTVAGSRTVEVVGSAHTRIGHARRLEVARGTTECFSGGRTVTVKGSEQLTVADGAHKCDHVTGQYNIAADVHFRVAQGDTQLYMKDAFYVSTPGDVQLKNAGFHLHARADGTTALTVQRALTFTVGRSRITMDASGEIAIEGPLRALLCAQGGTLGATAQEAYVEGPRVVVRGETLAEITAPLVKIN
jgi:type VI secretion system secreted protein VgrG